MIGCIHCIVIVLLKEFVTLQSFIMLLLSAIYLSIHIYLSIYISIYLSIYVSLHLSIELTQHPSR